MAIQEGIAPPRLTEHGSLPCFLPEPVRSQRFLIPLILDPLAIRSSDNRSVRKSVGTAWPGDGDDGGKL